MKKQQQQCKGFSNMASSKLILVRLNDNNNKNKNFHSLQETSFCIMSRRTELHTDVQNLYGSVSGKRALMITKNKKKKENVLIS